MTRWLMLIAMLELAAGATAQINHPYNEVGIYTVPDPVGCEAAQIDVATSTRFTCYLVLINPYNETLGRPVTTVSGFEFRVETPPDLYLLTAEPQPQTGWTSLSDFIYGGLLPVSGGYCTLLTLTMLSGTDAPQFVSLLPVQDAPQIVPGEIVFTDFDDGYSLHVMHPVSGSFDVPVFAVNWDGDLSFCETVPATTTSFGALKALYR